MTNYTEIHDVKEAIDIFYNLIKEIKNNKASFSNHLNTNGVISGLWFRGELDYNDKGLTPSIFRDDQENKKNKPDEAKICSYLSVMHEDIRNLENRFDKICMMRHYGIKSRILDWTENFLTALYFAVQEIEFDKKTGEYDQKIDRDGKLFCLNAVQLNKITSILTI